MREIATESGKFVVVPDEGRLTGPFVDLTAEMDGSRLRVLVPAYHVFAQIKRAEVVVIATGKVDETGLELVGEVESRTGHVVLADPHILYKRPFGEKWVRPDELTRALRAVNRHHRVGSVYPTDHGETAVAVRVSTGASRYELSDIEGGFQMKATVFHHGDE
jgi:hypothetical protein